MYFIFLLSLRHFWNLRHYKGQQTWWTGIIYICRVKISTIVNKQQFESIISIETFICFNCAVPPRPKCALYSLSSLWPLATPNPSPPPSLTEARPFVGVCNMTVRIKHILHTTNVGMALTVGPGWCRRSLQKIISTTIFFLGVSEIRCYLFQHSPEHPCICVQGRSQS